MFPASMAVPPDRAHPVFTTKGHALTTRNRIVLGLALAALASPAFASAIDPAPLGVDEPAIASPGASSLAGYFLAARQAGINKDLSAAAGFYGAALEADPQNGELLDRSVLMNVASGNVPKAAELALELLERSPGDQVALIALAVHQLRTGEIDAAIATVDRLGDLGGQLQELVAALMKAWALTSQGQAATAVSQLDELQGPVWFDAFTTLHAGLIADHARLFEIAGDRLTAAYGRDPGAVRVVDAYARHLARAGDIEAAETVIEEFEARVGGSDQFTGTLRREIKAGDVAPQIVDPREGLGEALFGIGSAVGREGGDTFAASLLQLALYLAPDAYFPTMALGQVLESMNQYEAAIATYQRIAEDSPLKRGAQVQEALNLNVLERYDEAIALLLDLVRADPSDISTAVALGNVYRSREQFEDAAEVYTTAIASFGEEVPDPYWTLFYYRGIARERTGQWTAAEKDFRRALEMEPENPLVLNYLGYSYIDRGENLDEALDMVRRAVAQRPDDGYIVDSLGWAFYRLGRYEEAVAELEKAVQLRPADAVINDHLGDAYWKVGRKLEAMFQWRHARDADPEPDALATIMQKLAEGLDDAGEPRQRAASIETIPSAAGETGAGTTPAAPVESAPLEAAPSDPAPVESAPAQE